MSDELAHTGRRDQPEVRAVRLADLSVGYSPRQELLDEEHVQALLEVLDRLPPIIIEERTKRVLDGVHRLEAFRRAGRSEIRAVVFSGTETEALVVAVQANIKHGKPLSRAERHAAAATLLHACPERSDRWLAEVCGLSHSTVARVRQTAGASGAGLRTGRDGRRRPGGPSRGQAAMAKTGGQTPGSGTLQVATTAQVTSFTTQSTKAPFAPSSARCSSRPYARGQGPAPTPATAPTLDLGVPETSAAGPWLARTAVAANDLDLYLADIPFNRLYEVADECRRRAGTWAEMATALEKRARAHHGPWPGHEL